MAGASTRTFPMPTIQALGDSALLVRFGDRLSDTANRSAIALAQQLDAAPLAGVEEVVPSLVSVMLRYDPMATAVATLSGELRLRLSLLQEYSEGKGQEWTMPVRFDGPDLEEVAALLGCGRDAFIAAHNQAPLRVLTTGFAPGFVYCGLHEEALVVPRRSTVRPKVPAGSVLFAAGQTAIAATDMPTGWHVIGQTDFINFDPKADPPTRLAAGDVLRFVVAS